MRRVVFWVSLSELTSKRFFDWFSRLENFIISLMSESKNLSFLMVNINSNYHTLFATCQNKNIAFPVGKIITCEVVQNTFIFLQLYFHTKVHRAQQFTTMEFYLLLLFY